MRLLNLLAAASVGTAAALLGWRLVSERRFLPCPPWLNWLLEGPLFVLTPGELDRMVLAPGQRVLEIGPGPGRLLIPAARRVLPGGEVVGLEIQPAMASRLRARAEEEGVPNLSVILGDAARPHVAPASFDTAYLVTVLGELTDREATLREAYAALKPGGRLYITETIPDPHYQRPQTVRRFGESTGFRYDGREGAWWHYTAKFTRP